MNVLVDTSVWVGHFRQRNDALIRLMEADQVLTHPLVVAELACGTPPAPRAQTLGDIGLLQAARQATLAEVIALVEREQLYGLGCGLVDVTLLASTLITPGARLWTLDQRLSALSVRFGVVYRPRLH
ncbi:putative toxin of a toxin/antitoxin system, PIN domain [Cupriavidus taiwanensis]|uniref:Toxin of a toxin/antitoxin system, PIN domain n=1 Tax=Cupriavidus taiwanensis TaxID=164546 RepID=A0A976B0N8_9BURK|nr:PIN domain-containing protein [Cupriavidus taiwanensis]SOZ20647.1 putative toxin of a toxin/antitoxin system, PIN domain [Cupriavidus taiwanensis]SOZ33630.1 putative toxin of a toxin/antitoxin system, PIN domain [Cupriavidus taiwanensis]SOZ48904.1 putative toxin of a toxin/antitoxin system, PIN domain [Cupriavidus taiwanensis]SOZ63434.1 putative toxin of a toxin/antitoxin system, PIN domain [Cupriavidus taiwanensis]SOZ64431.1 putative toxin of a toxin/antitoxin system, PIN domain [Cupriavid